MRLNGFASLYFVHYIHCIEETMILCQHETLQHDARFSKAQIDTSVQKIRCSYRSLSIIAVVF